jgi:hypothetical protein
MSELATIPQDENPMNDDEEDAPARARLIAWADALLAARRMKPKKLKKLVDKDEITVRYSARSSLSASTGTVRRAASMAARRHS